MKNKLTCTVLFVFLSLLSLVTHAQNVAKIESRIALYLQDINKFDDISKETSDSLSIANKNLLVYLDKILSHEPATLSYDFKLLDSRMSILTSEDKAFRVYFWCIGGGGSARSFNGIIQYKSGNNTKTKILNDVSTNVEGVVCSGSTYDHLYTVSTGTRGNIYLLSGSMIIWNGAGSYALQAFSLGNGKLNDSIKVFRAGKNMLNSIDLSYDLTANVNRDKKVEYPVIRFSADRKKIYVPIIKKDDEVTAQSLVYVFDGDNYVFDKNAK